MEGILQPLSRHLTHWRHFLPNGQDDRKTSPTSRRTRGANPASSALQLSVLQQLAFGRAAAEFSCTGELYVPGSEGLGEDEYSGD